MTPLPKMNATTPKHSKVKLVPPSLKKVGYPSQSGNGFKILTKIDRRSEPKFPKNYEAVIDRDEVETYHKYHAPGLSDEHYMRQAAGHSVIKAGDKKHPSGAKVTKSEVETYHKYHAPGLSDEHYMRQAAGHSVIKAGDKKHPSGAKVTKSAAKKK